MARVDDLIDQVADPALRAQLSSAVSELKKHMRFGIVFEEHVPEVTALLGLPVEVGALVQARKDVSAKHLYRVKSLKPRGIAVLEPTNGGTAADVPVRDLMVVKRFGDPIYPSLTTLGAVRRGAADAPHHVVINAENYHAIELMLYMYEGQADCIYLDPPYNTGARDWKYNNRYVDSQDSWRHSKWLSFLEKRLVLAKRMLKADGVLIIMIDEHEVSHLGMLLEKIFPGYLRHMITIVVNPKGTGKANFARIDEYAFFCVPDTGTPIISGAPIARPTELDIDDVLALEFIGDAAPDNCLEMDVDGEDELAEGELEESSVYPFDADQIHEWELRHARRRGGESSYRHQRPNQFYAVYIDEERRKVVRVGESLKLEARPDFALAGGLRPLYPVDRQGDHRCWRFIPETMQRLIDEGRVVLGRYHKDVDSYTINIWYRRAASKKLKTVWWETKYDAGTHGTSLLYKMLGRRNAFPFPKSVYAVRDCIAAVTRDRPDALVIDFFAGSGTTLHATCLLNAEAGGHRRCVLVTNNEVQEQAAKKLEKAGLRHGDADFELHGIFEQATRPRCEAAINGRRPDGEPIPGKDISGRSFARGFDESVEFFRLDYLDPIEVDRGREFAAIHPLLWLAAGGVGQRCDVTKGCSFLVAQESNYAVLFRESSFRDFRIALETHGRISHVWLVTDSEEAFSEMRSALPGAVACSMLYRDYLQSFRLNVERPA